MQLRSRVFTLAKDPEHPEQLQDACRIDPARGVAAVADGVASAIFSAQWARLLTEATVADAPDPNDRSAFAQWLQAMRQAWSAQIDVGGLAWFQKAKLPLGAFSTLLWVQVTPVAEDSSEEYRLQGFAIGDSCLFHVRGGEVLGTFPVQSAAELQADPIVLGSVDLKRDQLLKFASLDEPCYQDDLLVLCTDAIAEWALRLAESGAPPAWEAYWDMTDQAWQDEVRALREQSAMRYDDATLVLLRVGPEVVAPRGAEPQQSEEPPLTVEAIESEPETAAEPIIVPEEDWVDKLRAVSQQVTDGIDQVSDQVLRGIKSLQEKAMKKYRERSKGDRKRRD